MPSRSCDFRPVSELDGREGGRNALADEDLDCGALVKDCGSRRGGNAWRHRQARRCSRRLQTQVPWRRVCWSNRRTMTMGSRAVPERDEPGSHDKGSGDLGGRTLAARPQAT